MKSAFLIYIKSIGIYALLTLPTVFFPIIYVYSIILVLLYGWFAWALFTLVYMCTKKLEVVYHARMLLLYLGIAFSVGFSYQMMQEIGDFGDVWHSEFIAFPVVAIIAGGISLNSSRVYVFNECTRSAS